MLWGHALLPFLDNDYEVDRYGYGTLPIANPFVLSQDSCDD